MTNARTGEYIERARITIDGTTLETFTGTGGQYRLVNVPPGEARVRVFFTGSEAMTQAVTVAPGTVVRRDFSLDASVVKLAEYVVASSKEMAGAAIAINEQRFASNIVPVVVRRKRNLLMKVGRASLPAMMGKSSAPNY